jgi:hypothetical protein
VLVKRLVAFGFLVWATASVAAHPAGGSLSVVEKAAALEPGQYFWDSKGVSPGPLFLVIDLSAQRVTVYRNGVLIAASTISTGSEGRETPTGVFTILEKEVEHRSGTYDNAPMPYMQRITSKGVAMHAGNLPGYAASHGCIRLPEKFAKLLYDATQIGTPVMITDAAEIAERARTAAEYQRAKDEFARETAEQREAADRAIAAFNKAKATHERLVRQHDAEMAKFKSEVASQ